MLQRDRGGAEAARNNSGVWIRHLPQQRIAQRQIFRVELIQIEATGPKMRAFVAGVAGLEQEAFRELVLDR